MHSAWSVKAKSLAFFGIFAVWATIAFAQIPEQNEELIDVPAEKLGQSSIEEESAERIVPHAPLREQRNTLCDTSYSRITNCVEEIDDRQLPDNIEVEQLPE